MLPNNSSILSKVRALAIASTGESSVRSTYFLANHSIDVVEFITTLLNYIKNFFFIDGFPHCKRWVVLNANSQPFWQRALSSIRIACQTN